MKMQLKQAMVVI